MFFLLIFIFKVIYLSDAEWNLLCEEFAVHGTVEVTRELAEPNETALLSYEPGGLMVSSLR